MAAVALSTAVLLISFAVAHGFQREVSRRVLLFAADFQLLNLDMNTSYEQRPIDARQPFLDSLRSLEGIRSVEAFGLKAGIIKTRDQMQGGVLRGVGSRDALQEFSPYLVRGRLPSIGVVEEEGVEEVALSQRMASQLYLDTGQAMIMYFVQRPPRVRRFQIVGIYETQLAEFDETFILCGLAHVQSLNDWAGHQVGGFEVRLVSGADGASLGERIEELAAYNLQQDGSLLSVESAYDRHPQIFDWLRLLDTNVVVLLGLMLAVAAVNMVTALLILILDRAQEVGLLKALGMSGGQLRMVFVLRAARILLWGLCCGNGLALALLYGQWRWHIVGLDPSEYYIDHVPVELSLAVWLGLNGLILVVTCLSLLVPSGVVGRVSPAETLRFS